MKYKKYFLSLLLFIVVILLNLIFKDNIFLLTVSLPLFLIITCSLMSFNFSDKLKEYKQNKDNYSILNITKYSLIGICILTLFFSLFIVFSGILLEKIFLIKGIIIVYFFMCLSTISIPILNIIKSLLDINGYDKLHKRLFGMYTLINLLIFVVNIVLYLVFKINITWIISFIYLSLIIGLILVVLIIRLLLKLDFNNFNFSIKKQVNYFKEIKDILNKKFKTNIFKMLNYFYIYLSIIFVYVSCIFKYGFDYNKAINIINNTYFYSLFIVSIVVILVGLINKKADKLITFILDKIMPYLITLIISSGLIWKVLFNSYQGSSLMIVIWILSLFIILYININNLLKKYSYKKRLRICLLGVISKGIITLPLIDAFYRMGYSVIYGDLLATIISLFLNILLGTIYLIKKEGISIGKFFEKIIMIIYKNIILCLALILIQYVIPINVDNRFFAFLLIIVYILLGLIIYNFKAIILKLLELK